MSPIIQLLAGILIRVGGAMFFFLFLGVDNEIKKSKGNTIFYLLKTLGIVGIILAIAGIWVTISGIKLNCHEEATMHKNDSRGYVLPSYCLFVGEPINVGGKK